MEDGESEIDDPSFFLSVNGRRDAKEELEATLDALFNEKRFDDNSTACRFPARKAWLKEKLDIDNFVYVACKEYDDTLKVLDPKSVTLVFPSAHINSPASMFGHTFLRINSSYKSRLLSFAVNYAADADPDNTSMTTFALKGIFGGYYGKYSLLPYYEKLKEYRDAEQRDIWEYDLNLNEEEVLRMFRHIWELNGTNSSYYFFTQNCSYNMLWFIELARPSIHLREYFSNAVIPLETVHAANSENIIISDSYRPSKRTKLLEYEKLINEEYILIPKALLESKIELKEITENHEIQAQQKMYILEATIELLEYSFSRSKISKKEYLDNFHQLSSARASLGSGKKLDIKTPPNPIDGHRAVRASLGAGVRENSLVSYLGIRPAYHDIQESNYGYLRGTQIEFLNLLLSYSEKELNVEEATILSITSIAQKSEFFDTFSWRTKFGFDRDNLDYDTDFIATVGGGFSWGNKLAYTYVMLDPFLYAGEEYDFGIGASLGLAIDKYDFMNTNFEITRRLYDSGNNQLLAHISQNFKLSQNLQIKLKYDYIGKYGAKKEESFAAMLHYYF